MTILSVKGKLNMKTLIITAIASLALLTGVASAKPLPVDSQATMEKYTKTFLGDTKYDEHTAKVAVSMFKALKNNKENKAKELFIGVCDGYKEGKVKESCEYNTVSKLRDLAMLVSALRFEQAYTRMVNNPDVGATWYEMKAKAFLKLREVYLSPMLMRQAEAFSDSATADAMGGQSSPLYYMIESYVTLYSNGEPGCFRYDCAAEEKLRLD